MWTHISIYKSYLFKHDASDFPHRTTQNCSISRQNILCSHDDNDDNNHNADDKIVHGLYSCACVYILLLLCVCVCGIFNGHPFCPQCLVILCAFTIKLTMNRTISLTQEHIHIGRTTFEVVLNRLFLSLSPFQHCSMKITVPNRLWACAIVTLSRCYSNGSSCEPCCGGAVNIFTISQKLTRWKLREKRKLQIVPDARVLIAGLAF